MKDLHPRIPLSRLCGLFDKSRQAFYQRQQVIYAQAMEEEFVLSEVKDTPSPATVRRPETVGEVGGIGHSIGGMYFCAAGPKRIVGQAPPQCDSDNE